MTSPPLCADCYAWAKTLSPPHKQGRQTSSLGQFGGCRSSKGQRLALLIGDPSFVRPAPREHLPSRPQKFAAARAQGLSRLAAFHAATRQGLALIGPSTAARSSEAGARVWPGTILNRWFSSIFRPLLTNCATVSLERPLI